MAFFSGLKGVVSDLVVNANHRKMPSKNPLGKYRVTYNRVWGRFFETLWTVAHQTPLSIGFSRQEYWSG